MSDLAPGNVSEPDEQKSPGQSGENDDDLQAEIEGVFVFGDGLSINKCYAAFELLQRASDDERARLIQVAAEYMDRADSSKEIQIPVFINDNEQDDLKSRYSAIVDELFELILNENKPEDEFYRDLWDITQNPVFRDTKSKVFAFYWIMIDKRMPYFQVSPGYRMTNEDWRAAGKRLYTKLSKIRFLLAKGFPQRSEESSLILQEIEELDNQEDRIRALSYLIFQLRKESEGQVEHYKEILRRRGLI